MNSEVRKRPKEQIRVLRIIARMNLGGPAMQITGLYRGMNKEVFHTKIVTGYCEPNEIDYIDTQALDVPVTRIRGLGRSINFLWDIVSFLKLIKVIRQFKPTIVHTHTAKAGVLGRVACLFAGSDALKVHTFHGHLLYGYFSGWKLRLVIFLEQTLAKITDHLVAVGSQVKRDLLTISVGNSSKFSMIPPGIVPVTKIQKSLAKKRLGISDDTFVMSFVGRLEAIKRVDRLLDAVHLITQELGDYLLLVAGDGRERVKLEQLSIQLGLNVNFLGWQDELQNILSASDVSIHTSDNEGVPVSLIQSSFSGVPSISTNVGSVADIVLDRETGLLCAQNPKSVSEAILEIKLNSDMRSEMGKKAKLHAEKLFTVDNLVRNYENLYLRLVNGGQSN